MHAGHPASVDALVAFDEDSVVTGSQDGLIRLISILPNRMLGVLGEHGDLPVESLAVSFAPLQSLIQPVDYSCASSHLGLIECLTLIARVSTQHHMHTFTNELGYIQKD